MSGIFLQISWNFLQNLLQTACSRDIIDCVESIRYLLENGCLGKARSPNKIHCPNLRFGELDMQCFGIIPSFVLEEILVASGEAVFSNQGGIECMAWYAVHVRIGNEDEVCEKIRKKLANAGYDKAYRLLVPKRKLLERHNGLFVEMVRTMFPGYVLVESEDIRGVAKLTKSCKGIFRYLESEGEFQEIRLEEVSAIVYMTDEAGVIGSSEVLLEGDVIEVTNGPLRGYEGLIKRIDKHHRRASVLFFLDGRQHFISLAVSIQSDETKRNLP